MKKIIVVLMALLLCFSIAACTDKKTSVSADYDTIQDAINAHRDGVDIVGKTIKVELKEDKYGGIIYAEPDLSIKANLYLTLIADKTNTSEIATINKGKIVVAKVDTIDDHLVNSIYIFSKEYQIY